MAVADVCHEGMIHYFYAMPRMTGLAEAALARMGAEVATHLGAIP